MTESSMEKVPGEIPGKTSRSLFKRVIRGSIWTIGGHGASQIIRLASNLIISRLLFPEAFGLMALVYTFLAGLEMLSDFGVFPNIIQSKRGDDPKFLNTAWTLNGGRGIILWLCACLIAWPVSIFYKEPILQWLLPVAGLTTIMSGFVSTKWATANRHLDLRRLTIVELSTQILSILIMIGCAFAAKLANAPRDLAVWSLVVGTLFASAMKLVLSHTYLKGEKNHFEWDKESLTELAHFGRWIFFTTLLTFFAIQGSNLVVPRLMGVAFMGVFSFAQNLARLTGDIVGMLGSKVLFPSYSELVRDRPERLYPVLRKTRLVLNWLTLAVALFFVFFGEPLIHIMYDKRYADAGWMLQILALGSLVATPGSTYTNVLLAQGKTAILTGLMAIQVVLQFTTMFVGYYLGGDYGVIVGIAAMAWFLYPFQAICYARLSIWQPEVDLPIIGIASGLAALIFFHRI
ncbi:MAG: lipopolysaccharide biosynthesis protein [Leptolyngbyaceae cyanobacterium]